MKKKFDLSKVSQLRNGKLVLNLNLAVTNVQAPATKIWSQGAGFSKWEFKENSSGVKIHWFLAIHTNIEAFFSFLYPPLVFLPRFSSILLSSIPGHPFNHVCSGLAQGSGG